MNALSTTHRITHWHMFCGLGGGAKGFNKGQARVGSMTAKFECIGGVDVDPASIRDFTRAAGVEGTVLDLFDRDQYTAFHGKEPPADWREATVDDIRSSAHGECPDIIFFSAPCKGFSGLLPEASSKTAKYQALNRLTVRGVMLMLEAFQDDPPSLIIFENVPRIMVRGRPLLDQIHAIYRAHGYDVAETTHDCGVIGGLGQSRKRFLMVARHRTKVPPFLYEPPKRRLRGVGEILEKLPLPGDLSAGPMHRMPALQWKTWLRLALVEAGKDWRSLNRLSVTDGFLDDYGIVPEREWRDGTLGVLPWDRHAGAVTAQAEATTGNFSVADPREFGEPNNGSLGVKRWDETGATVTSNGRPASGQFSVADPRVDQISGDFKGGRVVDWEGSAGAITTQRSPGSSAQSVADPRIDGHEKSVQFGVGRWDQPAAVVKGDVSVGTGRYAVPDPRFQGSVHHNNVFRIVEWADPAGTVTAGHGPSSGGQSVADPRMDWNENAHASKLAVQAWEQPGRTIGGSRFGSGGGAVADPRPSQRADYQQVKYRVTGFDEAAGAVIAASTTGNGAFAVADPRPVGLNEKRDNYETGGHYGVTPWDTPSAAVPGFAKHDRGRWSVADPRAEAGEPLQETQEFVLPAADQRLVAVIRALDGTWHRPFTTLELAALQSLVDPDEVGQVAFDGVSDSAWRERIGNAVPPDAAAAIASVMGTTLLLAAAGETFVLSSDPIWVSPLQVLLAVDHGPNRWMLD